MKEANLMEPKQYLPAMEKIHYKGVAVIYAFDANHNLKQSPVTVYSFKGGVPEAPTNY